MKKIIDWFILCPIIFLHSLPANGQEYEVKVHAGTELLHIINYLAGVYHPAVDQSSYLNDIEDWFGSYKHHKAVKHASELPYNDFADLGWCIEMPSMELSYPEKYGYFEPLKSREYLEQYLQLCRQFAIDTHFWKFFVQHKPQYKAWELQFITALEKEKPLKSLYDFYQVPVEKTIYFSISPIGVVLRANIFLEQINSAYSQYAPVIIPYDLRYIERDTGKPNFEYSKLAINNNIWHEVSHIYWEELSRPFRDKLMSLDYQDSLSVKFNSFEDPQLNLYYYIHEVVSDGVAILLKKKLISEEEAEKHLSINEQAGSPLYRRFVDLLDKEYWPNRKDKNFQNFIPAIIGLVEN